MQNRLTRRGLIGGTAALTALTATGLMRHTADAAEPMTVPLDYFDAFKPAEIYFNHLRPLLFDKNKGMPYLDAIWKQYGATKDLRVGERALMGMYIMFRITPTMPERLRVAQAATKMALAVRNDHPGSAAGYVWAAVFPGLEVMVRGPLESAHLLPEVESRLLRAVEIDPGYVHGMALGVLAKVYIKAPPFPVSIGNLEKGYQYLERTRPYQERKYALWYIFLAEAELQVRGKEAAFAVLDRIRPETKPVDVTTAYMLDTSLYDALLFKKAVNEGTYNKYEWDPLLEMAKPGLG